MVKMCLQWLVLKRIEIRLLSTRGLHLKPNKPLKHSLSIKKRSTELLIT